jgi:uncharacterized protein YegP (UPF0339 family)
VVFPTWGSGARRTCCLQFHCQPRGWAVSVDLAVGPVSSDTHQSRREAGYAVPRYAPRELCRCEIHREEEVMVSSTQRCGGDWQWQLCSSQGSVLAEGKGFGSEHECRDAVAILRDKAGMAAVVNA